MTRQCGPVAGKTDLHANKPFGQVMKLCSSFLRQIRLIGVTKLFVIVVHPMVIAGAEDRVGSDQIVMIVEFHDYSFSKNALMSSSTSSRFSGWMNEANPPRSRIYWM